MIYVTRMDNDVGAIAMYALRNADGWNAEWYENPHLLNSYCVERRPKQINTVSTRLWYSCIVCHYIFLLILKYRPLFTCRYYQSLYCLMLIMDNNNNNRSNSIGCRCLRNCGPTSKQIEQIKRKS